MPFALDLHSRIIDHGTAANALAAKFRVFARLAGNVLRVFLRALMVTAAALHNGFATGFNRLGTTKKWASEEIECDQNYEEFTNHG